LAALNNNGIAGSVLQQINHGISTSLLFLLVGFVYERRHTRQIADFGGLAMVMPRLAFVFAVAVFSSAGLPLLNGFIGEFTILQGAFVVNRAWAGFAVLGIVLGAAYLLWLYQRTMLGDIRNEANRGLADLSLREWATVLPLMGLALAIGVYPKPWFAVLERPVVEIVGRLAR
jgi:NADH-quinone oxidoreductase subunit M